MRDRKEIKVEGTKAKEDRVRDKKRQGKQGIKK